ncbi:MAG: FCD domain-containing protein [Rhodopseudomonas sp.]|nr:FCD domain-containing protein [Rhodopseudomonas sp.]
MPPDPSPPATPPGFGEAKLSNGIYQRIFEAILAGEFAVNARLPSEIDLAQRFGASRPVVREALARLRDDGIIVSRQGSGSYVKRRPDNAVLRFVPVGSIADIQRCFEFRAGLEGAAAALAAERRDADDLGEIEAAFDALEASVREGRLGVDADERFHIAIAKATHNDYYVSVQTSLHAHIVFGMNLLRNLSLLRTAQRLRLVQNEHRAIVDAITASEPQAARIAMQTHIDNARRRMFDGADT